MFFLLVEFLIKNPSESWKTPQVLGVSGCFVTACLYLGRGTGCL